MESTYLPSRATRICSFKSLCVLLSTVILIFLCEAVTGQITIGGLTGANSLSAIQTSVPFLTIAPDGRSSGMGDVGVASIPDVNSQHWNVAKYAFMEGERGLSLTYTPWLTNLIPDIDHLYVAGYFKIDPKNTVSSSFRYFSLGTLYFSSFGVPTGDFHPKEYAVDAGYSRRFTDRFSGGLVLRYIHSVLTDAQTTIGGQENHAGTSFAGDFGLYYQDDLQLGVKDAQWALGLHISNIGSPVSYTEDAQETPIPTNLRLGGRFSYHMTENHVVSFHADMNKLLVPSPAVYEQDSLSGELLLIRGKEAPASVILGMFQSLYDAPGVPRSDGTYSVTAEELHEIMFGLGAEYAYMNLFAIRTGYFHEHATKGNRKYVTFGIGARYRFLAADISYLLPVNGQNSPLANTFRFTLTAEFGKSKTVVGSDRS